MTADPKTRAEALEAFWAILWPTAVVGPNAVEGLALDAIAAGLIERVPYDPEEHGEADTVEEGEMICVEREWPAP